MKKLASYMLLILVCITPILVKPFGDERFSFPKAMFLYLCCLIMLIALITYRIKDKRRHTFSLQGKLILVYIFICIISTLFTVNLYNSLIGRSGRWEGLFAILCYVFLFFIASFYYEFNINHLRFIAVTSMVVSILGILQFFGYDLVYGFGPDSLWYKQCFSTIGHRNFVGSYICLMLPLMSISFIYLKDKLCFAASCLLFLCMLSSTTRSAWLSMSALLFLLIVFTVKKLIGPRPLLLLICAFAVLFVTFNYVSGNVISQRYASIYSNAAEFDDDSGSFRIFIWKRALPLVWDRPLLGAGIDNFAEVFMPKYGEETQKVMPDTTVDKAHNEFLQIAVATGIPSLLVYLSFLITMFIKSLRLIKKDKKAFVLFCCILAYQMQAFFNISVVSVAPLMWILLGILNGIILKNERAEELSADTVDEIYPTI
ncbi:MAG: O-antigen ligase family protein [Bacillota bacterium]|nr:O-antigen ligase family protein [Bacillota bacterium]